MFLPGEAEDPRDRLLRLCSADQKASRGSGDLGENLGVARTARTVFPTRPAIAGALRPKQQRLTLGCRILDDVLGGGLLAGTVTELYGEAGTGKTHLALQLCLAVQLPRAAGGLDGDAIVVSTEPPFNAAKLFSILQGHEGFSALRDEDGDPGSRIYVIVVDDLDTQHHILKYQLPHLLTTVQYSRVRLLVLDSITANFRGEHSAGLKDLATRGTKLFELGSSLKTLAARFGLCVVVTNQVTGSVKSEDAPDNGPDVKPSLGLSWGNVLNTRLRLSKRRWMSAAATDPEMPTAAATVERRLEVDFAPHLAKGSGCTFEIYGGGVRGLPD
ncbi:P-loop containing nucleoside triphosphate hydrolase protein [Hyaloraphidium curvatum]|nr:P-loop containing nucleoside triphosphate hydrolase protein [Hyaloraphidium curvatum]